MEKDQAIRNQKVFIRLDNLITVQSEYHRMRQETSNAAIQARRATGDTLGSLSASTRKLAIEWVLDTLQLPREGN